MKRGLSFKKCIALFTALTFILQMCILPGSFVFAEEASGGNGLKATYYSDSTFTTQAKVVSGVNIDSDLWARDNDASGNFSVTWVGSIIPKYSENYTFYAITNGTFKVTINGDVVFNLNNGNSIVENRANMARMFQANQKYAIKVEYSHTGDTTPKADLLWKSESQSKERIPVNAFVHGSGNAAVAPYPYFVIGADSLTITPEDEVTYSSTTDSSIVNRNDALTMETETTSYLVNSNSRANPDATEQTIYPVNWNPDSDSTLRSEFEQLRVDNKQAYSNKVLVSVKDNALEQLALSTEGLREWKVNNPDKIAKAANVSFKMYIINEGDYSATNVKPSFIIKLGKKELASIAYDDNSAIAFLESGEKISFDSPKISLTVDEVRAIENGTPVTVELKEVVADVDVVDAETGLIKTVKTSSLISSIDNSSAEIVIDSGNGVIKKKRVYVDKSNGVDGVTLGAALNSTFGVNMQSGKVYIDGSDVNSNWKVSVSSTKGDVDSETQYKAFCSKIRAMEKNNNVRLMDIILDPGMQITFVKYTNIQERENANKSDQRAYWASYSHDFKSVYVCIPEVENDITKVEVEATVYTNNAGNGKTLVLQPSSGTAFYSKKIENSEKFDLFKNDATARVKLTHTNGSVETVNIGKVKIPKGGLTAWLELSSGVDGKRLAISIDKTKEDASDAEKGDTWLDAGGEWFYNWVTGKNITEAHLYYGATYKDCFVTALDNTKPITIDNLTITEADEIKDLKSATLGTSEIDGSGKVINSFKIISSNVVLKLEFATKVDNIGTVNSKTIIAESGNVGLGYGATAFKVSFTK